MRLWLAPWVLILISGSPGQVEPPTLFDAWVELADKGIRSQGERARALEQVEAAFHPKALDRRRQRRTLPGLFDEHDLPLHPPYLEEIRRTGVQVRVQSRWLNGVSVLGTQEQLASVESLPFVAGVTDIHPHVPKGERPGRVPHDPDLLRGGPEADVDSYGWSGPHVRQLNLQGLHEAGLRGAGIRIGVIDTGFLLTHPAFENPRQPLDVVAQWDFVDNDPRAHPEADDAPDEHEHGSLILGILAANSPGELMGTAPEAEYVLLRAEDSGSEYSLEERWFVAALEFAEANGVDIVSSSLVLYEGYDEDDVDGRTSVMAQGWNLATGNGIIGFQGGGNAGHDGNPDTHHFLPPAGAPLVVTVGAVTSDGSIAPFSSDGFETDQGSKPELLALGYRVPSISPYERGAYTTSNGTSMATPVLAGAAACLLQLHPTWTAWQIREALFNSGDYFRRNGHTDRLHIRGYGVPDLVRAAGPSLSGG